MKKDLSAIILVGIFFVGLSVLLYPAVSEYWNARVQSKAVLNYENTLLNMTDEKYEKLLFEAEAYNKQLKKLDFPLTQYRNVRNYGNILNISENGVIGYITIDKINVELPIYHGTSPSVLNIAAGHLEGSSLPIGGDGTHSVISAHRGCQVPSYLLI